MSRQKRLAAIAAFPRPAVCLAFVRVQEMHAQLIAPAEPLRADRFKGAAKAALAVHRRPMARELILALEFPAAQRILAFEHRRPVSFEVDVEQRVGLEGFGAMGTDVFRGGVTLFHVFAQQAFRRKDSADVVQVTPSLLGHAAAYDGANLAGKRVRDGLDVNLHSLLSGEFVAALRAQILGGGGRLFR